MQVWPSPTKPALHVQVNEPVVLSQVARALHPATPPRHSLMSTQVFPSPLKPLLQVHTALPVALEHAALASHPAVVHGSIAAQVRPSPLKPALQVHTGSPVAFDLLKSDQGRTITLIVTKTW